MSEIQFTQDRETKNTIRYQEEGDPPAIGTLYIQKHWLKAQFNEYPKHVWVAIRGAK